ncbi:MAG: hypothetical protein ACJ8EF_01235, partial [Bradyrhizobium sp.]
RHAAASAGAKRGPAGGELTGLRTRHPAYRRTSRVLRRGWRPAIPVENPGSSIGNGERIPAVASNFGTLASY